MCGIFINNYQSGFFTLPFLLLSPQRALVIDLWVILAIADREEMGKFSLGKWPSFPLSDVCVHIES